MKPTDLFQVYVKIKKKKKKSIQIWAPNKINSK